jgi:WhiB family redox-sensing transcriptional regulator
VTTGAFVVPADQLWKRRAVCAQTDPEAFFPEKGYSARAAKAMCARCEVRPECLDYALDHDERFGVWGGLSERQRRPLHGAERDDGDDAGFPAMYAELRYHCGLSDCHIANRLGIQNLSLLRRLARHHIAPTPEFVSACHYDRKASDGY